MFTITGEDRADYWAMSMAAVPLRGWALMLGIGHLHHSWWSVIPPMGFWTAVLTALIFSALLPPPTSAVNEAWYRIGSYSRKHPHGHKSFKGPSTIATPPPLDLGR